MTRVLDQADLAEIAPHRSALGRAVFVQFDAHYGGSPISGAMVVRALVAAGWQVDAVFASPGPMTQEYEKMGCQVHVLPHGQWLAGGSAWRRVKRWVKESAARKAGITVPSEQNARTLPA